MEFNSNFDKLGSVKDLIVILEKSDKTVLQIAKEFNKNYTANSFRKALGDHIVLKIVEQQKVVSALGQGDMIVSDTIFINMVHLINFQKSVLDLLTPTTQRTIDKAILPITRMIPDKDFNDYLMKMVQYLNEQYAAIQASTQISATPAPNQEQLVRPTLSLEKLAHFEKVLAGSSQSKKPIRAIPKKSPETDEDSDNDL